MTSKEIDISIVVPLYNEKDVFHQLVARLNSVINQATFNCEVILINDGSVDNTASLIQEICKKDSQFTGVLLSRNHRHQFVISAGLKYVRNTIRHIMNFDSHYVNRNIKLLFSI